MRDEARHTENSATLHFLRKAGMHRDALQKFAKLLSEGSGTGEEQKRMLKKQRYCLMREIHAKQQFVDRIDYILYQMAKERR